MLLTLRSRMVYAKVEELDSTAQDSLINPSRVDLIETRAIQLRLAMVSRAPDGLLSSSKNQVSTVRPDVETSLISAIARTTQHVEKVNENYNVIGQPRFPSARRTKANISVTDSLSADACSH